MTKDERQAYDRRYYLEHRERRIAQATANRLAHPVRHAEAVQRWRERWPDRLRESKDKENLRQMVRRRVLKVLNGA